MSLSVLVVDDNKADQFISEHVIKSYDATIRIDKAYDGKEALDMLSHEDYVPHYIFLDINMPRMDGMEFLEAYHKLDNHSSIIVMLTSSVREDDYSRCMAYPHVKECIPKPLSEEKLAKLFSNSAELPISKIM